jgi:hypothetical protein
MIPKPHKLGLISTLPTALGKKFFQLCYCSLAKIISSWVARPMNGQNGYFRTGRFKKASNSNFCLNFANKVERTLKRLLHKKTQTEKGCSIYVDPAVEEALYQEALAEELAKDSRAKAAGHIRMGEFILMVDSDTRVVG